MLMLGIMTATLLAGTIGYALTDIEPEVEEITNQDDDGVLTPGDDNFVDDFNLGEIFGGEGDDLIDADVFGDTVYGGEGDDKLVGAQQNDDIRGGAGDDVVSTGSGDDAGFGEDGNDVVQGGSGDDWLSGGAGDDFVKGDAGNDILFGGLGTDVLRGGEGNDTLVGADIYRESEEVEDGVTIGFEDAVLYDTDADGFDALNGDEGEDRFILGAGDYAIGGQDADTFLVGIWAKGDPAIIEDYQPGERILVAVEASMSLPELSWEDVDGDRIVTLDGEPLLILMDNGGSADEPNMAFTLEVFDTRPAEE